MTWPELAGSVPAMTLNAVDLPDPVGTNQSDELTLLDGEGNEIQGQQAPK
ncbi:MAG TPA: hypothetical protein VGD99_23100 [Anaerolineae bacterium]|jgi:hypothetical protein